MNAVPPVDAAAAAGGPLATLQALAEAVGATLPGRDVAPGSPAEPPEPALPAGVGAPPAAADAAPLRAETPAHADPASALPPAAPPEGAAHPGLAGDSAAPAGGSAESAFARDAAASPAADAQHGLETLGRLAAESPRQAADRAPAPAPADAAPRHDLAAAAAQPSDLLQQPVLLTPLAVPPLHPGQAREPAADPERRPLPHRAVGERGGRGDGDAGEESGAEPGAEPDGEESCCSDASVDAVDDGAAAGAPAPRPADANRLAAFAGRHSPLARAELERGRSVLLLLPAAAAPEAVAWLFDPVRARRFAARWHRGALAADGWHEGRVFRDGDPLLAQGLAGRVGGARCRIRLGTAEGAGDGSDPATAWARLGDRARFAQALGAQWTLLVVAAPAGTGITVPASAAAEAGS